jgi:hypothetical protein
VFTIPFTRHGKSAAISAVFGCVAAHIGIYGSLGLPAEAAEDSSPNSVTITFVRKDAHAWSGPFDVTFDLPEDCQFLGEYWNDSVFPNQGIDVRKFLSLSDHCKTLEAERRGSESAERDFISSVDLSTLSLDVLPWEWRFHGKAIGKQTAELSDSIRREEPQVCAPKPCKYPLSYLRLVTLVRDLEILVDQTYERVDFESCRMIEGKFAGHILVENGWLLCMPPDEDENPWDHVNLEISNISYRDVNEDGFLDAVVTIQEVSYSNNPVHVLNLTKTCGDCELKAIK